MDIIDLFFPRQVKCIFCGRETKEYGICEDCYDHLPFVEPPYCVKCGGHVIGKGHVCVECKKKETEIDSCYSVLYDIDDVAKKIVSFKQSGAKYLGESFAYLIEDKFKQINERIDMIIPVPISERRLKERGYNQSEILCNELPKDLVKTDVFARIEDTPHQTGLGRSNRLSNLKGAFKVLDKKSIKGNVVLILDDIYTTGSTLNECARTLKSAGAKKVIGLTLARAKPKMEKVLGSLENKS